MSMQVLLVLLFIGHAAWMWFLVVGFNAQQRERYNGFALWTQSDVGPWMTKSESQLERLEKMEELLESIDKEMSEFRIRDIRRHA
jgi:hypothetical protein